MLFDIVILCVFVRFTDFSLFKPLCWILCLRCRFFGGRPYGWWLLFSLGFLFWILCCLKGLVLFFVDFTSFYDIILICCECITRTFFSITGLFLPLCYELQTIWIFIYLFNSFFLNHIPTALFSSCTRFTVCLENF